MARLAVQQRQRRRVQAGIGGAVALIVVAVGATWLLGGFENKPAPVTLPVCNWTAREPVGSPALTGLPPTDVPTSGVRQIIINTSFGEIRGILDVTPAFCGVASVDFLAKANFYNDTTCHHLDTAARTLTCGSREPSYQFDQEGVPHNPLGTASPAPDPSVSPDADPSSYYAKGAILLDNLDAGATTGSALMFVYDDGSPLPDGYTKIGDITTGMEIIERIAAAGAVDDTGAAAATGTPAEDLKIISVTLTADLSAPTSTPTATPEATASPSAS